MSKFTSLYREYTSTLTEAVDEEGNLVDGNEGSDTSGDTAEDTAEDTAGDTDQPQVPSPQDIQEPQQDITSEGKKFLVELVLKALSVDPDNIPATEKSIFNTEVTTSNAEEVLKKLQYIVDLYS